MGKNCGFKNGILQLSKKDDMKTALRKKPYFPGPGIS